MATANNYASLDLVTLNRYRARAVEVLEPLKVDYELGFLTGAEETKAKKAAKVIEDIDQELASREAAEEAKNKATRLVTVGEWETIVNKVKQHDEMLEAHHQLYEQARLRLNSLQNVVDVEVQSVDALPAGNNNNTNNNPQSVLSKYKF